MDNFGELLTIIGSVLGIIVLVTGALLYINGSYNRARMNALREDNDDLRHRVDDTEAELSNCKTKLQARNIKIESLETENRLLVDMITQRAEVEAISDLLEMHHKETTKAWRRIEELLRGKEGGDNDRQDER